MILAWCDDFHARTKQWPNQDSGLVLADVSENWKALDVALRKGHRGLPGGSSLARLLASHRGHRNKKGLPPLTEAVIVALADVHFWWTKKWPTRKSGPVVASPVPKETWSRINDALVAGTRGLPGGSSLAQVLATHRQVRNKKALPPLTEAEIVAWADAHFARTGVYPSESAGPIAEAPGETWYNVSASLREGCRGFPGGSSVFQVLVKHGRLKTPPQPKSR